MADPATTQATFCATLVDEWARSGVRHAVIAPGSRSTPMALALATDDRIAVHVHHDERCAAFMALGVGVATGVPAIVLCTSGTATTHLHAAVVEAHQARVPLLAVTADRPPEMRGVGAPQTIDQLHLYGTAVRWFHDAPVADEADRGSWRSLAAEASGRAVDGPVHLNLPFREPLVGDPGELPPATDVRRQEPPERASSCLQFAARRPLVVATRPLDVPPTIPVIADARSGIAGAIRHADALLRVDTLRDELRPDLVVRVGLPPASRVVNEWLASTGAVEVCDLAGVDPYGTVTAVGHVDFGSLPPPEAGWLDRWRALDDAAETAIATVLAGHPEPTEPGTARDILASLPPGAHLVVASSMPVRDLEWYATPRPDVRVHANRGANGIDGTISTAIGVALGSGAPTTVLVGDVAFLHDAGALIGLADRDVDLRIVVVDNDGGGIFSFLPQADRLSTERFEQLFGTPHGVDVERLAAVHGIDIRVVRTDRAANRALHDELHAAVAAAVDALSGR